MNKTLQTLFLALAIFASVAAAEYVEEDGVLVLGDNDLDQALKEFEYVLGEFYAPWCGHCKKLAPEYVKAAAMLKAEGSSVKLAKVDCTEQTKSCEKYGVQGYPTLKFFVSGEPVEYEGGRTDKEIVAWLRKKTQPSVQELTSAEHLTGLKEANDVVVVFFGGKDHELYGALETASKKFDDVIYVYTSDASVKSANNVADDTNLVIYKKFDDREVALKGTFDGFGLSMFVKDNATPLVLPFDQKAAQKIFGEGISTLFLLYKKDEAGNNAAEVFNQAAKQLKGKLQFSLSDIEDGALGPRLAEFVGVTESEVPTLRLLEASKAGGSPKKFQFDKEMTVENILSFHDEWKSGSLSVHLKSEPVPETNDEPVKIVVGKNFKDLVLDTTKDVFVEFYAPWCGHCKKLTPIWDQLATDLASISNLVIAKMDSTANEVESVDVSGFPTLKFFPANAKDTPIDYDGDRTLEGFKAWLKDRVTVEHAASTFTKSDEL